MLKRRRKDKFKRSDFLSIGSTLGNLACSGRTYGGLVKGEYLFLVGDSQSGKTWLEMSLVAEASINPHFDDYQFIYDGPEGGALMDIPTYFGKKLAKKLNTQTTSYLTEEFYYNVYDYVKEGPCIYLLDSMDALDSKEDMDKFEQRKEAFRKARDISGSYGTGKAKVNSGDFRKILRAIRDSGSILCVISQTRDNIGFGSQFKPKTRAGGKSLTFYATLEVWTNVKGEIRRKVRGKNRHVGNLCTFKVVKNRFRGWHRQVDIPIYHSFGVDDVGSCVSFLIDEGHWKGSAKKPGQGKVVAPEFKFKGRQEDLIRKIEEDELEKDLHMLVKQVWDEIETECSIQRKNRYE